MATPVSETKARFSELARKAALGVEVLSINRHDPAELVSIVRTDVLTAALAEMKFTLTEELDAELGVTTVSVSEIPIYGEGASRESAIQSLIDTALDYKAVYLEKIESFRLADSAAVQALMLKLIRCGDDRASIRQALGL